MKSRLIISLGSAAFLVFAATGLVTKSGPAVAQQTAEAMDEIVVEAPIMRRTVGRSVIGSRIEDIELTRRVSYADLDLSRQADVIELQRRVAAIAEESCRQLSDMFPLDPSDRHEIRRCTDEAVEGTVAQVQAAIESAS